MRLRGRAYTRYQRKRMIRRRMPLYPWVDKPGKLVIATAALANGAPRRDTRMLGASGSGRRGERLNKSGAIITIATCCPAQRTEELDADWFFRDVTAKHGKMRNTREDLN